ncbi:MAG: Hsp70 family protein [Rickettsiaceae bacterium]|nr:Hsp70 family protein [Rickettsiaceae bacterium]
MLLDIREPETRVPNKNEVVVGIDFGTTNSLVGVVENGKTIIIPNEQGQALTSSEIEIGGYVIKSIKRLFGKCYWYNLNSDIFTNDLKYAIRFKDDKIFLDVNGIIFTPEDIGSMIFGKLKTTAENYLNKTVHKAVVTVPAYFDDVAKTMIKNSARLAGIEVVRMIAEPTAAAYYWGLDTKAEGNYMVYDFGGGTFDVSILKLQMGVFQVVSLSGDSLLGGDDIDVAIAKSFASKYKLDQDQIFSSEFLRKCRKLKESSSLSFDDMKLNKKELELITKDIIDRTISLSKKALYESKLDQIDGIILVGGSTKLPIISEALAKNFEGVKIISDLDPDTIVAKGAARQAANLANRGGDVIIDVLPLSLGVEVMGGVVDVIIPRNTPIPASITRKFTTQVDNQTSIDFHVVQGDRELASECRSLGRFKLANIPVGPAGSIVVDVIFTLDADGLLTVKATENSMHHSEELIVNPSYGITDLDIVMMLKSAMEHAEEDHSKASEITIRYNLKNSIVRIKSLLSNKEIDLPLNEINELREYCIKLDSELDELNLVTLENELKILNKKTEKFFEGIINKELKNYLVGKKV